jgi:hypothetical protein
MKTLIIIGLLLIKTALSGYGQNTCRRDIIHGTWKSIGSRWGIISNIDSLKRNIVQSDDLTITWVFQSDGTYTYTYDYINQKKPSRRTGTYLFEEKTCEIILGTKRKARENANYNLLYADEQYLIVTENNNPKGDATILLARQ